MSNGQDIALHFLMLPDDKCPTLDHVLAAMAAQDGHGALAPLPAGVTFDPADTGAVYFASGITDPKEAAVPSFWIGAQNSVAPGSQQYANIAYNTQTEEFTEERQWLPTVGRQMLPLDKGILTGLPSWDTANGPAYSPTIRNIPLVMDTLEKAVAYIRDPKAAWALYGPK
jgi:hypothetical protein